MCSAFQSSASALRIPCAYNRRRYLLSTTATTADGDDVEHQHQQPVDAPYFPIHYNDVYVVDMPPGHRYVLCNCRDSLQHCNSSLVLLNDKFHVLYHVWIT